MLSYLNGMKLVSKYFRTLALEKWFSLFRLSHNDKSISSVVIKWCNFERPWPSICEWETLIFYIFLPFLDWSTQSAPRTEETRGNTHERRSGAGLGLLRQSYALETKSEERGGGKFAGNTMPFFTSQFLVVGGARPFWEENLGTEMI